MEKKDLINAMWKRRAVRKYLVKNIEQDKIEALRSSISALNKESGLTMEFIEKTDAFDSFKAFMFKNVRSVIAVKGKTNDPNLQEKCGYFGEQIVLEATALGLGTCWVISFTFKSKSESLNVKSDETIVCGIPIGYGEEAMSTSTEIPDAPHRKTKSISEFLNGKTDVPEWVTSAVKAVQFAPTARNSQKTRFNYADGKVSAEIPVSDMNLIDLGITKFHFELAAGGKFPLGTPSVFVKDQ
ncbi:MAG: nitroreductase family protein [Methanomassiliicoccaceae archaeon]|nr:nitroreductase family protein [Methanomassiliicoccaceae archaeon]